MKTIPECILLLLTPPLSSMRHSNIKFEFYNNKNMILKKTITFDTKSIFDSFLNFLAYISYIIHFSIFFSVYGMNRCNTMIYEFFCRRFFNSFHLPNSFRLYFSVVD